MRFDRHTLVLLVRPPGAPELSDDEAAELQGRHLAFRADLRDRGLLIGGRAARARAAVDGRGLTG